MSVEVGFLVLPVWLLGDSNPQIWEEVIATPLDPCHPVHQDIWTSILDIVQE